MTACRQRQQWAALYRSCLLSVLVKSDAIGGLIECKRLVKWSAISHLPFLLVLNGRRPTGKAGPRLGAVFAAQD